MRRAAALLWFALALEWRMYVGAARLLARRPDVPAGTTPVRYAGAVAALLWGITIMSAVELVALHLIIPWHAVRIVADVLGIWGVVWCLGLTACHYVYPHLVTPATLHVRAARRRDAVTIPWSAVASVHTRERSTDSKSAVAALEGVGQVAVGNRTNVDLVLSAPVELTVHRVGSHETHEVREVRVYVDDPREFVRAARLLLDGGAPRSI